MNRREFLRRTGTVPALAALGPLARVAPQTRVPFRRVRPSDPGWPSADAWAALKQRVGGRLIPVPSVLAPCRTAPDERGLRGAPEGSREPVLHRRPAGRHADIRLARRVDGGAERLGRRGRADAPDVAAAVEFARRHDLRLVVKGGGHSYQGTSNAPDSLLVWTRGMHAITLHDAFVPAGCRGAPRPAVTVESGRSLARGVRRRHHAGGPLRPGGGCATVGVAGLVQSGGFGSFSKRFGTAAVEPPRSRDRDGRRPDPDRQRLHASRSLLGAEGRRRREPRRRHARDARHARSAGAVRVGRGKDPGEVRRRVPAAHRRVLPLLPDGAPQSALGRAGRLRLRQHAHAEHGDAGPHVRSGAGGLEAVPRVPRRLAGRLRDRRSAVRRRDARPALVGCRVAAGERRGLRARAMPGPALRRETSTGAATRSRPTSSSTGTSRSGCPRRCSADPDRLADALFPRHRRYAVGLHFNKGLAGAPADRVAAARDTATNPAVLDAFALAIIATGAPHAGPGQPGHEPDLAKGRAQAAAGRGRRGRSPRRRAERRLLRLGVELLRRTFQKSYWGPNYSRLSAVKKKYDPDGLFFVHNGVGSEEWSRDGFTRLS